MGWASKQPDVSVWRTEASYKAAAFGMRWCNDLLRRHGHGRWCVCVDPDEFLVYPYMETRSLPSLTSFLDEERRIALEAVGDMDAPPILTTYGDVANMVISLPPRADTGTGRQQHHLPGMPFGTRGGFIVEHNFPADGEYELTIGDMALAREVPKMEFENTVIALLDGEEFYRTNIGGEPDHKAIDQLLDPAVEEINGRLRKIPFHATAGQHTLAIMVTAVKMLGATRVKPSVYLRRIAQQISSSPAISNRVHAICNLDG